VGIFHLRPEEAPLAAGHPVLAPPQALEKAREPTPKTGREGEGLEIPGVEDSAK